MDRRAFLWAGGCAVAAATAATAAPMRLMAPRFGNGFLQAVLATEQASGGRLGLAVIDTATGERFLHRGSQLFPMCSTFKFALAAAILRQVEQRKERLDRRIPVRAADIVPNSPFCESRVGGSASVGELCRETIKVSDNAAANLLLRTIAGPAGFTRQLRGFGDTVSRLDRWETDMGEAAPGDPRDTTSPLAFAQLARRLVLGDALAPASRAQLTAWMKATTTSRKMLRAGLPKGWVVADKTGSGGHGTANLLAVAWPPHHAPVVVASYITGSTLPLEQSRPLHARIGRALAEAYA